MSSRHGEDHTGKDVQHNMVGGYIIGQRIGQGSFATVYKGQHKDTKTLVAVKSVLRSRLTPKLLENLESEIAILKGIRHNHIVELVDCQKTGSHIHLIMEFCSLGDLSAYIKRRKGAPAGRGAAGGLHEVVSRHFLKQLASALEFLRSQNLIHRDIKPQNLLLLPPNTNQSGRPVIGLPNFPTLKIADFGFARSLPSHSLAETLCGSPLYMAPEILRYEKYDAKADLWSVGAVLYEMVTGRPPFRALNHVELLRKIEKGGDKIRFPGEPSWSSKNHEDDGYDVDIPVTSVPLVSDDMKDVIRHLLKRNPVERASFEEFFLHPAVTADLEGISAAAAVRVVVDDGLTVAPPSAQLSLPQPPTQTISTPARRPADRYEPPPFAQQDSRHASPPREQRKQPLLKRQEDLGFANVQFERQGNRPASEGARRSPLPPQGVVSRNTVGMQRNVEKEALMENRQINNVQSDPYRAHDPLISRPTTRVRPIRSNSYDVNSPPNSILIQRPGDFMAADEAEQREREIPGLPKRRGSIGGTGTESFREFYKGTASTMAEDDVMIEREYVVVDKGAVEVNELADQLAASPVNNMIVTRTRSFRQNSTSSGSVAHSPSPPFISPYPNYSSISPPGISASHYGTTPPFAIPGSTTTQQDRVWNGSGGNSGGSALAKAITAASMRLLGPGNSPPSRGEKHLYNRRGSSGSTSPGNAIVVFGGGGDDPEEDAIIKIIEDAACKAHAVEQLAQAKYDMIAPPPPAAAEAVLQFDPMQDKSRIADEALVLYIKTLALLQSGLDVAKDHWSKQRAGLANKAQPKAASVRLNGAVQWMRNHFNECLEKAEFVKSKASSEEEANDTLAVKLLYERAKEISRKAAVTELLGDDLAGCEYSYQMAIWMLEAILDTRSKAENEEGMDDEDRRVVNTFINSITDRLNALRKRVELATAVINGSPNS